LPLATANPAAATLQNRLSGWRVKAFPFAENDGTMYSDGRATLSLLRDACDFAEVQRDKSSGSTVPRPSRILLCYVDSPTSNDLLTAFGFSTFPVPVDAKSDWKSGKSWRFNIDTVVPAFMKAIEGTNEGTAKDVRLRIEAKRPDEVLLLPSRNYILPDKGYLSTQFEAAVYGRLGWPEVGAGLASKKYTKENLGRFYARVGGNRKHFHVDDRGLVFANSSHGLHGPTRQLQPEVKVPAEDLRRLLEGLYRFGTPVLSGFQHDVQYERNKDLANEPFECSEVGTINVSGTHANLYTNDVVRPT